jgi:hypothetical protein
MTNKPEMRTHVLARRVYQEFPELSDDQIELIVDLTQSLGGGTDQAYRIAHSLIISDQDDDCYLTPGRPP